MSSPASRQQFADELRGFALLGIAVVNAPFLGISLAGFTETSVQTMSDRLVAMAVIAFAQAKFYLLFSFLFGYSFTLLLPAGAANGAARYLRRLTGLALIGAVHATLFFVGDILVLYAVLGLALLWLTKLRDRRVLQVTSAATLLWLVLLALLVLGADESTTDAQRWQAELASADRALAHGSFIEAAGARWDIWPLAFLVIATLNGLPVLAMFGIGLVAGRRHLLAHPEAHPGLWRRGSYAAVFIGLPGGIAAAWLAAGPGSTAGATGARELLGILIGFATAPALSFGYVAWMAQARARWPQAFAMFRPAGRMSLTGYIGESVLMSLVFCGYGLGFFGQWGAARVVLVAVAVWVAVDIASHLWQQRLRYGPLEYVLRWWSHAQKPTAALPLEGGQRTR